MALLRLACSYVTSRLALIEGFAALQSWANLFKRRYLPATITAISMASFQQLAGINSVM